MAFLGEMNLLYDWLRAGIAGWRFILVPSYRQQITNGWKFERWYYIVWDIVGGLAGIALSLLIAFALVYIIAELNT
jgi:hypothetical protein